VNIRAEFLGIQLHSDSAAAIEKINAALEKRSGPIRVELLTWYQLPADVRGMYPCLLESAGRPAGPAFTVQGITTQGYWIERPLALTSLPDAAAEYRQMALAGAASGGRQSVCVQTDWTLQQAAGDDWRVAGRILTTRPPAWIVAQSDTDIRRDDQAPTSRWKPGQRGSAFSLLRFPNGAPPGDYTLQVGIYSRSHPNGLDRLVNGIPVGGALTLAAIQPAGTNEMPETIQAQQRTSIVLDQGAQLVGYDAQGGTLSPGQELRVTLHLTSQDRAWSRGTVTLRGDGWELAQPVNAVPAYSLDWHAFVVPADASGTATLAIESETTKPAVLATYTIEKTDRLFVPPPFDVPVNALFSGMAELEGFSVEPTTLSPDQALELTLVWQVITTPGTSYKVFTHLLDANGQVIAQHDGFPVNGTRLTTGWVPGEYIVDPHSLTFLRTDYQGSAFLEVGLYNPETRERVFLSGGSDHLLLPLEITVQ
jgi:hypothetical protein